MIYTVESLVLSKSKRLVIGLWSSKEFKSSVINNAETYTKLTKFYNEVSKENDLDLIFAIEYPLGKRPVIGLWSSREFKLSVLKNA